MNKGTKSIQLTQNELKAKMHTYSGPPFDSAVGNNMGGPGQILANINNSFNEAMGITSATDPKTTTNNQLNSGI